MRVRRCDRCSKEIEPCTGRLFVFKKYYVKARSEDIFGEGRYYDLCDRCAKAIENQIKYGPKEV